MNKRLLLILLIISGAAYSSYGQGVYFNGLGRGLVTVDRLNGNILNADGVSRNADTTSARRGTGGYTIFDLGVNAQPNDLLRASAILRVRNEFGGFYGDGSALLFRQMRLDGVLSKIIKYEIGDIDLGLTPYTVFNFDEIYHDYEADIFANRRSVVHYENFNFGNKWRVQGFNSSANLKFEKLIKSIELRGFAARTRRTNFLNNPDRILYGGRIGLVQSDFFQIGGNLTSLADVANTVPSASAHYNNNVITTDYKVTYDKEKFEIALYGETGFSKFRKDSMSNSVTKNDFFYDLGLSGKYKPIKLKVFANYRNVGPNFISPAAQTRRIYDNGLPSLFPTVNSDLNTLAIRQPILFDRFSDETNNGLENTTSGIMRNLSISPTLMDYLPHYNNITPYGQATPNRVGITTGASYGDNETFMRAQITLDLLAEAVAIGAGNTDKRKFTGIKGGTVFNIHKLLQYEKGIMVNFGIRNEQTTLSGPNKINLTSMLMDAGLTLEVYKGLDLMGGYKLITAKGNEVWNVRDANYDYVGYTDVVVHNDFYDYNDLDIKEGVMAFGMRYRFGKNSYFTAQGHFADFVNNKNKYKNYNINQVFLNYTMIF
jgi:hypothetical protein